MYEEKNIPVKIYYTLQAGPGDLTTQNILNYIFLVLFLNYLLK